ncbi:MAG: hypothetical protein J5594_01365 [Elusimicrobiaceae bacterium]|nr:hypothetical protein [Elusimicrobiaceae bacterium]
MDIGKRLYFVVILLALVICFIAVYESFNLQKENKDVNISNILQKAREQSTNLQVTDVLMPIEEESEETFKFTLPAAKGEQESIPTAQTFIKEDSLQIPQAPKGFFAKLTNNYVIFRERFDITQDLTDFIDNIHGNFVLDIIPFSLNSEFKRLFLMLFRTRQNFTKYTLRPEWSQAATDVKSGSIYLMEGTSFKPVFIHELTHIYFDGFFQPSEPPLWLSEGYAVYNQVKVQSTEENGWIQKNIITLSQKNYINFEEFNNVRNLEQYSQDEVELWYTQAYSIVKFLIEKDKDSFYQFSKNLKSNMTIGKALYRAYGMPFNTLKALEYAWQAKIQQEVKKGNYYG